MATSTWKVPLCPGFNVSEDGKTAPVLTYLLVANSSGMAPLMPSVAARTSMSAVQSPAFGECTSMWPKPLAPWRDE